MLPKISNEALEAYCNCKLKFHLKLQGEHGVKTDYEIMRAELRANTQARARKGNVANPKSRNNLRLTLPLLEMASRYIFDGTYEDEDFKLQIDGVHKAITLDNPCTYSLRPITFSGSARIEKQNRLVLRVYGYAVSRITHRQIPTGLVWNIRDVATKVPLRLDGKEFATWLQDLLNARRATSPPPLVLNDHCQICEYQERCRKQATDEGNLSLLKGMTVNEIAKYNAKGLFTINQLSYTFRSRRKPKRARPTHGPHYFSLQAQALREKKVFIYGAIGFKAEEPRIYFDIEGTPDAKSDYLIGALVVDHGKEEFVSFWTGREDERCKIFVDFLSYISRVPRYQLIHFGSYETSALRRARLLLQSDLRPALDEAIDRATNLLSIIRARVYFPTYSNSLKEIGEFLGARWSGASPSGIQTLVWREKWLRSGDPTWRERLLQYNREDCYALRRVAEFLDGLVAQQDLPRPVTSESTLVFTDTLPRSELKRPIFQRPEFAIREFERINRCAYFDHRRDKIAARPGRTVNRRYRKRAKTTRWGLRLSKTAHIMIKNCPECRSRKIKSGRAISRTIIDLKFSARGVKRWIVRYATNEYRCRKCLSTFTPGGVPPDGSRFGWGLACWCIYNHLVAGQNLSRVAAGLGHLFRLSVPQPTVHRFKEYVADHYRQYCRELFSELIRGRYLHIDETPVKLLSHTGYVWVLTNGNTAYYFYRPSRQGTFLRDLLEGFSGVLISDFFTAYDSLEIPQQRCLIHLLRDFNEELLKAPYDQELRMLGEQFSAVLGAIVSTIDNHGLKRWHLSKHKAAAAKFIKWVAESKFTSRPACKLQGRIAKYQEMLFTFLDFDDVAWHNNNAERAIKAFARHRRFADGRFTTRSIEHYLTILTVYQTCELRGVDLLDFMLGRRSAWQGPPVPWILNGPLSDTRAGPGLLPGFETAASGAPARTQTVPVPLLGRADEVIE
jgi:predicted RecB family nuclease